MEKLYGWPVVTAATVYDIVRDLGIKPWKETRPNMPLAAWLSSATEAERSIYERFGPKPEVQFLAPPVSGTEDQYGKEDIFFRMIYRPWATVVTLIPGPHPDGERYVAVTGEYKQGNRLITLVPPSGVRNKMELGLPLLEGIEAAATREFEEETGISLVGIRRLGPPNGFWDQVRGTELSFFPFVGECSRPIKRRPSKLDKNEFLKLVLFPVEEWLRVLERGAVGEGFALESCAATTTYLALRKLDMLLQFPGTSKPPATISLT